MKFGPGPGAVSAVEVHQPARHRLVRRNRTAIRPARLPADLASQLPTDRADIVGKPERIAELSLQRGDSAIDLDMLGMAVLAPRIVGIYLGASGEHRP